MDQVVRKRFSDWVYRVFTERRMGFLAILLILILFFESAVALSPDEEAMLYVLDWVIIFFFIVEYALKFLVAEDRRVFFFDRWRLLDLCVIVLPVLSLLPWVLEGRTILYSAPALRLLRLLRVISTIGLSASFLHLNRVLKKNRFYHLTFLVVCVHLAASVLFYFEENVSGHEVSFYESLWWGVMFVLRASMGLHVFPQTLLGYVLSVVLMLTGIAFVGIITANIVDYYITLQEKCEDAELDSFEKKVEKRLDGIEKTLGELVEGEKMLLGQQGLIKEKKKTQKKR